MGRDGDLPSAMHLLRRQISNRPLSAADSERLLARREAHPEAPAVQHALAGLLASAAGPPSNQELVGEAAAVAGFMLVNGRHGARHAQGRIRGLALARRGRTVAAGIGAAAIVGFSGAAVANALPAPIQELAHRTFDAPAPQHAAPPPEPPVPSPRHGHSDPSTGANLGRSAQSDPGKAKVIEKKPPTSAAGSTHGKARDRTTHQGIRGIDPAVASKI